MADSSRAGHLNDLRFMVVEDEFLIGELIGETLEEMNATVCAKVGSLEKAWSVADEAALDGVVLDVTLRGENALPLALALVERGVRVVVISGHRKPADWPDDLADVPFLQKPFRVAALQSTLRDLFR